MKWSWFRVNIFVNSEWLFCIIFDHDQDSDCYSKQRKSPEGPNVMFSFKVL